MEITLNFGISDLTMLIVAGILALLFALSCVIHTIRTVKARRAGKKSSLDITLLIIFIACQLLTLFWSY